MSLLGGEHVIAVGPGLGDSDWSRALLDSCLESNTALVVDADGLNLLAMQAQQKTFERDNWILTPHPAEAARLLACTVREVQQDRVHSAQTIARRYGASVVLKGCGTVVADPSGA